MKLPDVSGIVVLGKTIKVSFVLLNKPVIAFNLFVTLLVISKASEVPSTVDRCSAVSNV